LWRHDERKHRHKRTTTQAYPTGHADWNNLVRQNKLIVDKTAKLGYLVTFFDFVFFSRPRLMGKTTLCSMLQELFAHGPQNFAGTAIFEHWPET